MVLQGRRLGVVFTAVASERHRKGTELRPGCGQEKLIIGVLFNALQQFVSREMQPARWPTILASRPRLRGVSLATLLVCILCAMRLLAPAVKDGHR